MSQRRRIGRAGLTGASTFASLDSPRPCSTGLHRGQGCQQPDHLGIVAGQVGRLGQVETGVGGVRTVRDTP